MPLTQVCVWSGRGWKKITASEAARKFPYGTSASSGLFMCDICGQYVTLTGGSIRDPYFKHSSEEKSKACPERTFAYGYKPVLDVQAHSLPIRLKIKSNNEFNLELGFVAIPPSILGKKDDRKITIRGKGSRQSFQYTFERLNLDTITYLSIGTTPYEKYSIEYPVEAAKSFWPKEINGIASTGSLFDKETGKKLPEDADVSVGHTYYLIIKGRYLYSTYSFVDIKQICYKDDEHFFTGWSIFEVRATKLDKESAQFFLDYHARLTDKPVAFYPIWPEFIEYPYKVLHRDDLMYFYLEGEGIESKSFPYAPVRVYKTKESETSIVQITCNERQQLVSAGRIKVLKYTYLWKDKLNVDVVNRTRVTVYDGGGNQLDSGEYEVPPEHLYIKCDVDGSVEIRDEDNFPVARYVASAGSQVTVNNICEGYSVHVICGLDIMWIANYKKIVKKNGSEERLLKLVMACRNDEISISHTKASAALRLKDYPKVRAWFLAQVRKGKISRRALNILKQEVSLYG